MRIAIFHNLPSGGAKRALHGFAKELKRKGHELDLFVPSTADETFLSLKPFVNNTTVVSVRKTLGGMALSTWRYIIPVRFSSVDLDEAHHKLAESINEGNYDITFVEQDRYTMSPFVLKYLQQPFVYYCPQPCRLDENRLNKISLESSTDSPIIRYARGLWKLYLQKRLPHIDRENARSAKYILTNSAFTKQTISKAYDRSALVCHLGIDPQIFRRLHLERQNYVLSVGTMGPPKGYDFLIKALGLVDPSMRPRLLIVSNAGNDRYSAWIEELARDRGVILEKKRLVSDEELVALYNRAALFLYAPHSEPLGLAPLEAMACGTPVIAVAEGGVCETVQHDITGILTARDEEAFAAAVEVLLHDKTRQDALSQNALDSIATYWNIQAATERLLQHMKIAALGRPPGASVN